MTEELGPVRDSMAQDCWDIAYSIAKDRSNDPKPFYILYSAKVDPKLAGADAWGKHVAGGIRQSFRLSYDRPPFVLGMLVWYVEGPKGLFKFITELSSPPDIPIDPSLLSRDSCDSSLGLAEKAKEMNKSMPLIS